MMKCDNCGWEGENKDLVEVTKTPVWGCPMCKQIFFEEINNTEVKK